MLPYNAKLTRIADAAVEPLSVQDARNYLRVEVPDDDALIADMITAARLECERMNNRSFITTTWKLILDYLPFVGGYGLWQGPSDRLIADDGAITLPMPPLIAISSLTYIDQGGVSRSIDVSPTSPDVIVSAGTPGRFYPAYGRFFPFAQPRPAAVEITYTAGYGPNPADVPRNVVLAMRMLVSHYYEHRTTDAPVPEAVSNLLSSTSWGGYA
jgi:uncharacterized phiE125 gp8 family phage protein